MNAVIIGATGLVGSELIKKMVQDSRFKKITVIARRSIETKSPVINEIIIKDLSEINGIKISEPDAVFISCLGTTIKTAGSKENFAKVDFQANLDFAKLAQRSDAGRFILVSSKGANAKSWIFYSRIKGELEDAVLKLGLKSVVIFRPGLLIGDRMEKRVLEGFMIAAVRYFSEGIGCGILQRWATSVETVVEVLIDRSIVDEGQKKLTPANIISL